MTDEEWESLCDRCGRCCLQKLEDEESGDIFYTNLSCQLLNQDNCTCRDYENRLQKVVGCLKLKKDNLAQVNWLPTTCAYRRLWEGRGLAAWHPLVSGHYQTVIDAGVSVKGRVVCEDNVPEELWEDHIVRWIEC